jgi:Ran GTPase-activating protein 1
MIQAAQEVAAYLKSFAAHGCLTHLDISDIIAGRPEEEALAVMLSLCAAVNPLPLLEVNLSDNAIGFRGVESIRNLLDAKQLQRLFVCNNGMSAEAVQLLSEALLAGEKGCPPLTTLHLYNNMCGNGGATAIASVLRQTPGLVDFR